MHSQDHHHLQRRRIPNRENSQRCRDVPLSSPLNHVSTLATRAFYHGMSLLLLLFLIPNFCFSSQLRSERPFLLGADIDDSTFARFASPFPIYTESPIFSSDSAVAFREKVLCADIGSGVGGSSFTTTHIPVGSPNHDFHTTHLFAGRFFTFYQHFPNIVLFASASSSLPASCEGRDNSFINVSTGRCVTCHWTHYPHIPEEGSLREESVNASRSLNDTTDRSDGAFGNVVATHLNTIIDTDGSGDDDDGQPFCAPYADPLRDLMAGDMGKAISAGNTAWVLVGTALVMLMTPALAFFYGGMASEGNVMNTMMLSIVSMAIISLFWVLVGYSLVFSPGGPFLGGFTWGGLNKITELPSAVYGDHIPHLCFVAFQCMFAAITPALISGAIVGRMKFRAYCIFIVVWSLIVYCPLARWTWALKLEGEGEEQTTSAADGSTSSFSSVAVVPAGWLGALPVLDAAGGCCIHTAAGFAALAASLIVGARTVRTDIKADPTKVLIGAALLQFGWFGFNAGSALSAGKTAAYAFVNTHIATCAAAAVWLACETVHRGRCTFVGACTAVVIGLVSITPGCFFVSLMSSIGVGGLTALLVYVFNIWKSRYLGEYLDDTLDVFACHGLAGFLGTAFTGLFASEAVGGYAGAVDGNWAQVGHQLVGATVSAAYSFSVSAILLLALRYTIGVRVSDEDEALGLDYEQQQEANSASNASKAPREEGEPVAFVFTDIEKSTKLWSHSHALMGRLMDIHNKAIRAVISKHDAYEVKTVGDSFVIAVACPAVAVRLALDIQLALFQCKWDAPELDGMYRKWIAAEAKRGAAGGTDHGSAGGSASIAMSSRMECASEVCSVTSAVYAPSLSLPPPLTACNPSLQAHADAKDVGGAMAASFPPLGGGGGGGGVSPLAVPPTTLTPTAASGTEAPAEGLAAVPPCATNTCTNGGGGGGVGAVGQWNGLRVRIGLHYGDCEAVYENTTKRYDYRGAAVAMAARVEGQAHGGQILASSSTWLAAKEKDATIAEGAAVMHMGDVKLRGIRAPVPIVQVMPIALASRRFAPMPSFGTGGGANGKMRGGNNHSSNHTHNVGGGGGGGGGRFTGMAGGSSSQYTSASTYLSRNHFYQPHSYRQEGGGGGEPHSNSAILTRPALSNIFAGALNRSGGVGGALATSGAAFGPFSQSAHRYSGPNSPQLVGDDGEEKAPMLFLANTSAAMAATTGDESCRHHRREGQHTARASQRRRSSSVVYELSHGGVSSHPHHYHNAVGTECGGGIHAVVYEDEEENEEEDEEEEMTDKEGGGWVKNSGGYYSLVQ